MRPTLVLLAALVPLVRCLASAQGAAAAARALSGVREVIFIRHGQSIANVAPESARSSLKYLDAPLTDLGRQQADAWASNAAAKKAWDIDVVLTSPLIRAIETSARIFQQDDAVPIQLVAAAREGWWEQTENRGRGAAALCAGTATGMPGEPQLWPSLADLGVAAERIRGLGSIEESAAWDPLGEAELAARGGEGRAILEQRADATLSELKRQIMAAPARRLAVVCHYGVISRLCDVREVPNCGVLRTWWWTDTYGIVRTAKASYDPEPPPLPQQQQQRLSASWEA